MNRELLDLIIPLVYSGVGAGLVHSLFWGTLRRLVRKSVRIVFTGLLIYGGWIVVKMFLLPYL